MNAPLNRRRLLGAVPAFGFAGLMAAGVDAAVSAAETPVRRAYAEWKALRDFMQYDTADMPEEDFDALCDRSTEMERAMFALPNRNIADAVLKILAFTDGGNDFGEDGHGTGLRLVKEAGLLAAA